MSRLKITAQGIEITAKGKGPFIARSAADDDPDWPAWYVADNGGRLNVWRFPDKPTALFSTKEIAIEAARLFNERIGQ